MKKSASIRLAREKNTKIGMHIHEWRAYGPSYDGTKMYVMCVNRSKWTCPDCWHIPCLCQNVYPLTEWHDIPTR